MPRMNLPKIFEKKRFKLKTKPSVVLHYDLPDQLPNLKHIMEVYGTDDDIPVLMFQDTWIELSGMVALFVEVIHGTGYRITVYGEDGSIQDHFSHLGDYDELVEGLTGDARDIRANAAYLTLSVAHDLWKRCEEKRDPSVVTMMSAEPRAYKKRGSAMRWDKMDSLKSLSGQDRDYTPPPEPSGIKKREHGVRGHWRTYKSGVKVWVKAHRRGDPDLGTTTRVLRPGGTAR